jgi:hypothetical protein
MSLPDSISCLSRLAELDVSYLPPGLTACRQLTRLVMDSDNPSPVLASLHTLRYLSVGVSWPWGRYWTQLTGLTELRLDFGYDPDGQGHYELPAGLVGMTGIRKLSIAGDTGQVMDLPAGPYLSRLESLIMEAFSFPDGVPATLAAATQLRHLDISKKFCLCAADVAILSALPALTTLSLRQPGEFYMHKWDECLAQLEAAFLAQGRAPPRVLVAPARGCNED